jgi:hypothetical protein
MAVEKVTVRARLGELRPHLSSRPLLFAAFAVMAPAILAIAGALRAGRASPRAIVMLERLMRGGYGSALYEGRPAWLRQELGRIRFEIEPDA